MSEWLAVEAIVRQRDKEMMAVNLAKLSSESNSGDAPPQTPTNNLVQDLSNDVSNPSTIYFLSITVKFLKNLSLTLKLLFDTFCVD